MTRTRILFWTLLILCGVIILYKLDKQPVRGHVGRVIACSARFPFHDSQAEVLEYGLQDIRGLAWDEDKRRIFLSEGDRSLLIDWLDSPAGASNNTSAPPSIEETEARTICPDAPCGVASERGLAILGGKLFSAEHGRGQIVVRDLPQARFKKDEGAAWLLSALPLPGMHEVLTEPSGIAAVDGTLFITNEPLRPIPTSGASSSKASPSNARASKDDSNSAENAEESEKATAIPRGAVYVCSTDQCLPEIITSSLRHPSGVAAERANGPIIVAEADAHEVRWPVYEKLDGKWQETRSLGSVPASEEVPAFLGIALDDSRKMVFAAGPGGLYVFDLEGTLLGRIMFDDPVTGVATSGDHVYLAVGETLCALTFDHPSLPNTAIAPPPNPLVDAAASAVGQPAPRSRVPKPILDAPKAKIGPGKKPPNPSRPYTAQPDPSKKKSEAKRKEQNCECKKQKEQS